ncbi:MAG: hypothetical protein JWO71_945, partial [Candidatus Acidoferrum typicum]|nr:hypothetical protein [Candidatus Acidoferrum typicum]
MGSAFTRKLFPRITRTSESPTFGWDTLWYSNIFILMLRRRAFLATKFWPSSPVRRHDGDKLPS